MGGATTRAKKSRRDGWDRACDNSDDANWDRRHQHRRAGLNGVYKSKDAVAMNVLIAIGELSPADAPTPPDPYDRSLSKRQWEWGMRAETDIINCGRSARYPILMAAIYSHVVPICSYLPRRYAGLAQRHEELHQRLVSEFGMGRQPTGCVYNRF